MNPEVLYLLRKLAYSPASITKQDRFTAAEIVTGTEQAIAEFQRDENARLLSAVFGGTFEQSQLA